MSSQQFTPVACPLCAHPHLWRGAQKCPGCLGGKMISRFKSAQLFIQFPELSRIDTEREMPAVKEPKP